MRVAPAYSHRFRYCEYLGKYMCTGCHRNQISVIPARVLDRWDFTSHAVCLFAYRLLEQIWMFPLFRVSDLNVGLYEKVRALRLAKQRRTQLRYVQDFIQSCRFADDAKADLAAVAVHVTADIDMWAMSDFVAVRAGLFERDITALIGRCEVHVMACEVSVCMFFFR